MKPEMILQADVLDIIFDNRNKDYGAYELRRHYERRVKKSIIIIFSSVSLIIASFMLIGYFFPETKKVIALVSPDIYIADLGKTEPIKPEIKPKEKIQPLKRMAEINNAKPIIVRQEIVKPIATQDELADKIISNKTIDGEKTSIGDPIPSGGNGNGTEAKSQPAEEENKIFDIGDIERMPEFPGGMEALKRFLGKNLRMPRQDLEPGTKIATLVRFVVDKNGMITGVELEKSGGKDFDNEVSRVIKKMPQWKPGMQHGKNVAVYFKLPVIFQVPDEN